MLGFSEHVTQYMCTGPILSGQKELKLAIVSSFTRSSVSTELHQITLISELGRGSSNKIVWTLLSDKPYHIARTRELCSES
jgi:hypothetical protein